MIERYTLPEMGSLWAQEAKFETWLEVELAVLKVQEERGDVPEGIHKHVHARAKFLISRIDEIELEVKHDVIAFLTNVAEYVGDESRYVHMGMTSSDLIDTALSLQIQRAGKLLLEKLATLRQTVYQKAVEHQHTVMVGRSHGIHGEPITFGLKLLNWVDELDRQYERLNAALEENRIGQVSGAMGTYSNVDPDVEVRTCELLGLKPARISTQIISRDIHASLFSAFALLVSSLEKFATEIRGLQKTDILEVEEGFSKGQKGSSAMPHKRNPVASENITGLARLVRSYVMPALENIALWHERDISHSSIERVIFPDAFITLDYMLHRFNGVIANLGVHQDNMRRNLYRYGGVIFSQRVLLTLIEKGKLSRETAYTLVQRNAHSAWNTEDGDFKRNLLNDPEVTAVLGPLEIDACFDTSDYLKHVDVVFERFAQTKKAIATSRS
ncbi:MAG: adenylosuccinate lyase [Vampirovibrionales bacterium]|nr:adenylosuccinate lyase [Vampirovibrionales bacterium]